MPGFADWAAKKKPPAELDVKLQTFLLANDFLQTEKKGIRYRKSKRMGDIHESRLAQFGRIVSGYRVGKEGRWLKIGNLFLPMKVNGKPVLIPPGDTPRRCADKSSEMRCSAPELQRRRRERHEPVTVLDEADARTAALEPPPGALYRVCYERVMLRHVPDTSGQALGVYRKGDVITLLDWDESGKWRKCSRELEADDVKPQCGWVMLDHHDLGPLLRPLGRESDSRILKPMCVAASENDVSALQRFISAGWDMDVRDHTGKTPLMLAAEQGHLDCCVSLLEGRADAALLSNDGEKALDLALTVSAKGIISLLSEPLAAFEWLHAGDDETGTWFAAALELLQPKTRLAADAVVARLATEWQRAHALKRAELGALELEEVVDVSPEEPQTQSHSDEDIASTSSTRESPHEPMVPQPTTEFFCMDADDDGEPHEVVFQAVWVRAEPSVKAAKLQMKSRGQVVNMYESDETGAWRRVKVVRIEKGVEQSANGWMKINDEELGPLLKPFEHSEDFDADGWW